MLTIVQRGGATREKPPEAVRGQACRLPWAWDGLCFGVPFNDATRDASRDLVTNAAPSLVSGTLAWARDDRGNSVARLDTSSYLEYADNPTHNRPKTALTMYVRMRRIGTTDSFGGIMAKVIGTSDPFDSWAMYQAATANTIAGHLTVGAGTYTYGEDPYTIPTTLWVSLFFRWSSGTYPRLEVLGERGNTLSFTPYGTAPSGTIPYTAGQPIRLNATEDPAGNWGGEYSQAMVWSRRLSDVELQALVADPYGWYSPRRETIGLSSPYPLVFGGGEMKSGAMIGGLP